MPGRETRPAFLRLLLMAVIWIAAAEDWVIPSAWREALQRQEEKRLKEFEEAGDAREIEH